MSKSKSKSEPKPQEIDRATEICNEFGAESLVTSYDEGLGTYMTTITFADGHQVTGAGESTDASITNGSAAAILDRAARGNASDLAG